ncbi:rRNA maturation RNase YbeY [Salisaeta longa]|uniref:rRNA maturation RNase YbeY n=1 Tax=Salisaeta longa TaxID=503170 RepID=UPI0003B49BD6|nr:rRNA maturation RNase YbeY [Salisaeta longa]
MSHEPPVTLTLAHDERTAAIDALRALVRHVLAEEGATAQHVSIVLADHATVHELNVAYLDHDYTTDVLSFALHDDPAQGVEGEVYVDLDTAAERYAEFGTTYAEEVARYVVHGVLHLLGYDDASDDERAAMRALEDRYLQALAT